MKIILLSILSIFLFSTMHAQNKPKPPVHMKLPPPPKPLPPPKVESRLQANPLEDGFFCYNYTDTLMDATPGPIVRKYSFQPAYGRTGRMSIEDAFYRSGTTRKDLAAKEEVMILADSMLTSYHDCSYRFDNPLPQKAKKIWLTDEKGQTETYLIKWVKDKKGEQAIATLKNEKSNVVLRKGDCPAAVPSL